MRLDARTVHAPEIGPIWLNSSPLSLHNLRGAPVLVDFWDFTCINCLRTLPYVRKWAERYESHGLVTVGIHTPEFYFGQSPEILARAVADLGITYPVMLDNDYAAWKAFANRYWPSKYLIDAQGYIRYAHFGEGAYHETEAAIQELLRENEPSLVLPELVPLLTPMDAPGALAYCQPPTQELYLGHKRGRIANEGGFVEEQTHRYVPGTGPTVDTVELDGAWNSLQDCVAVASAKADDASGIYMFYSAAEVNLVCSPTSAHPIAPVEVRENGAPVAAERRGRDLRVDPSGRTFFLVDRPKMYNLIQAEIFADALLEIRSAAQGLQLFAFTFGSCMPGTEGVQ